MEPENLYNIMHDHYSTPWPPVYLESWTQSDITATLSVPVQRPYIGRTEVLCGLCVKMFRDRFFYLAVVYFGTPLFAGWCPRTPSLTATRDGPSAHLSPL